MSNFKLSFPFSRVSRVGNITSLLHSLWSLHAKHQIWGFQAVEREKISWEIKALIKFCFQLERILSQVLQVKQGPALVILNLQKFLKVKKCFRATQHGLERQSSWQLLMFSVFIMLWNKTNIPDLCCYIICSLISNVVILQGVYPTPYNVSSPPSLASVTPLVRRTYLETTDQEMDVWIKLKLHSPTPATVKTLSFTVTPVMGECGVQAMIKL